MKNMTLVNVAQACGGALHGLKDATGVGAEAVSVAIDSRRAEPGGIFIAVKGGKALLGQSGHLRALFVADPWLPLVLTGGDIAALSGFQAVVTSGVEVFPPPEQGEEKRGFLLRGAFGVNGGGGVRGHCRRVAGPKILWADILSAVRICA